MVSLMNTRKRPFGPAVEDYDAATLRLGPDFSKAEALTYSEALQLLQDERLKRLGTIGEQGLSEVFVKSLAHVDNFARVKDSSSLQTMHQIMEQAIRDSVQNAANMDESVIALTPYEAAQLASLYCEDVDEAVTLIPRLPALYIFIHILTFLVWFALMIVL